MRRAWMLLTDLLSEAWEEMWRARLRTVLAIVACVGRP